MKTIKRTYVEYYYDGIPSCCYKSRVDQISIYECQCQSCGVIYRMRNWENRDKVKKENK